MPGGFYLGAAGYAASRTPNWLAELPVAPGAAPDSVGLYGFDVAGVTHPFVMLSDGTAIDLTPAGVAGAPGDRNYWVDTAVADAALPNQRPTQALTAPLAVTSIAGQEGPISARPTLAVGDAATAFRYGLAAVGGAGAAGAAIGIGVLVDGRAGNAYTTAFGTVSVAWTAEPYRSTDGVGLNTTLRGGSARGAGPSAAGDVALRAGAGAGAGAHGNILFQDQAAATLLSVTNAGAFAFTATTWAVTATGAATLSSTGASSWTITAAGTFDLIAGTGAVNLASNATVHTTVVGTTATTSATTVQGGTGGLRLIASAATSGVVTLQDQTFTAGAAHAAVSVAPTWAAENFAHTGLRVTATQNGANTSSLTGIDVVPVKATAATVLDTAVGISVTALSVAGTVTSARGVRIGDMSTAGGTTSYALLVDSQTANAATTRAVEVAGTGVANAVRFGSAAGTDLYFSGANGSLTVADSALAAGTPSVLALTQAVHTGGTPTLLTLTGGAHTTLAASTEARDVNFNLARVVQFATGALATQRAVAILAPTYAFVLASTITEAATLYVEAAPVAGANATITSSYAFWSDSGLNRFDGQVQIGAGIAGAPGIAFQVDTNSGIRRNDEDEMDLVTGGASTLRVDNVGIRLVRGTVRIEDLGSAASPAVQLTADPNTGLFWSAADVLGLSAGATAMVLLNGVVGSSAAAITLTQPVSTSGAPTLLTLTGAAHTTLAASAEAVDVLFDLGRVVQHATGALAAQRAVWFEAPTYSFVAASTITDAATVYIEGAPAQGANATITQSYALWIEAGRLRADEGVLIGGEPVGVAGFVGYSNTVDNSANSTGVGTVLFKGATSRNSSGFLKILDGVTARFVPYFDAIVG